ncbi:Rv1733c family protein [Streptomyces albidoflavus]|uniref:Rv1733c family protein n=1 Tax=Streptomyces albidoflavus TaxID=1886 RepID=UPI00308E43C0|nr:hypothetical protein OG919_30040 [Streptomyces albidoflavus]
MRTIPGLWRWRRNPLYRRTDRVEAWLALLCGVLLLAGAPWVALTVGSATEHALLETAAAERAQRRQTVATVDRPLGRPVYDADPETAQAPHTRIRVVAHWTAPDGTARTGKIVAPPGSEAPGDRFRIWTDLRGSPARPPMPPMMAQTHAWLAGIGAATAWGVLVEGVRRGARWRIVRFRYARWNREWERVGPDWGRTGTGS